MLARVATFWDSYPMTLKSKHLESSVWDSAVSSVVEHFLDTEGVRGSNPLSRTISPLNESQTCEQFLPPELRNYSAVRVTAEPDGQVSSAEKAVGSRCSPRG